MTVSNLCWMIKPVYFFLLAETDSYSTLTHCGPLICCCIFKKCFIYLMYCLQGFCISTSGCNHLSNVHIVLMLHRCLLPAWFIIQDVHLVAGQFDLSSTTLITAPFLPGAQCYLPSSLPHITGTDLLPALTVTHQAKWLLWEKYNITLLHWDCWTVWLTLCELHV